MNLLESLLKHRKLSIASVLFMVGLAVPGLLRLRIDNRPEVFFLQDDNALSRYLRFQIDFGRDQNLRLVIRSSELWTPEGLGWLRTLEEKVESLCGVLGSAGIYGHHQWRYAVWPPSDIERFRKEVLSDRLDLGGGLVTNDGQLATIAIVLYNLQPADEHKVLDQLEGLCKSPPIAAECTLVGLPVLSRTLDRSVYSFALRYYPLLFLLAALLLAIVFRTVRDIIAALGLVTTCEILVLGLAGYSGVSINFINMVLVPILFVVALASSIHIHLCYRRLQTLHADSTEALVATYREKAWPVFWAGATTLAGFGSMVFSEAPPVRTLGAWTAFGVALVTVASFTLFPCLLATLLPGPASKQPRVLLRQLGLAGHAAASFAVRRRRPVIVFFFVVATLALAGTYRLREDTHILRYFEPEDPTKQEVERLEALGIGSLHAELIVKSSESRPDSFRSPDLLVRLAAQAQTLRNRPEIFDSLGAGDLLQNTAGWTSGGDPAPHEWREIEARVRDLPKLGRMYRAFVTDSGRSARLSLQIRALEYRTLEPVLADAIDSIRRAFPGNDVWITGRFPLILSTQRHLLRTMASSLGLTLLVILGVLFFLLRPGPAFWSAVTVNVWPIIVLVGVMAWFGFPLDSTTIMVASVTLALAVDDTFHTLGYLYRERSSNALGHKVCQTLEKTAPAQVLSSVVLAGGFTLCSTSSIVPISQFCFLAGVAIMAALLADLLLFPALLGSDSDSTLVR